jgi:hypothetical protein
LWPWVLRALFVIFSRCERQCLTMAQYLHQIVGLVLASDFEKLIFGGGTSVKEAQIHGAPVDGDHVAGAEPLGDAQGRLGADVNSLIEPVAAIPVVPGGQHAADGQQRGVDLVVATNRVKDIVGRHIDISRVMHDDAALLQDVTDTDGLVTALPAPVVVSGLHGDDVDTGAIKVIAGLSFQDLRESQVGDDRPRALGDDQLDGLVEFGEGPAVEMIDVRVGNQDCATGPGAQSALAPQRVYQDLLAIEIDQRTRMTQPCHLDRHDESIPRSTRIAASGMC